MNPHDPRLDLVQRYGDGQTSAEETAALEAALRDDPQLRQLYLDFYNLTSALEEYAAGAETPVLGIDSPSSPSVRPVVRRRRTLWLAVAASIVLGCSWAVWHFVGATSQAVAIVHRVGDRFSGPAPVDADSLYGRDYHLTQGLVEMYFPRGEASVVVEAPAEFRVEDEQTLRLASGRATAHVRDGKQGLRVLTPFTDVLDLGTRFAVDVVAGRRSEVHVFEGQVEANDPPTATHKSTYSRLLHANEAVRIASSGAVEASHLRSASFVQPEEIAPLAAGFRAGQSNRWHIASEALRHDPALTAWIGFDKQGDGSGVDYGGSVRGARWVQGRFAGKDALEFVDTGDAVQIDVGGQQTWPQLTMMVWVRLDRLDGPYQSLYHTDGWSGHRRNAPDQAPNVGQVHWIVLKSGVMRWAMWGNTPSDPAAKRSECWVDSHTSVLTARGRWVHLAVTYDASRRATRFYVDGRLDAELFQDVANPVVLGSAQIGNWNLADRKLSGRVDEFAILGRVLSDQEIQNIYAAGTPYR